MSFKVLEDTPTASNDTADVSSAGAITGAVNHLGDSNVTARVDALAVADIPDTRAALCELIQRSNDSDVLSGSIFRAPPVAPFSNVEELCVNIDPGIEENHEPYLRLISDCIQLANGELYPDDTFSHHNGRPALGALDLGLNMSEVEDG